MKHGKVVIASAAGCLALISFWYFKTPQPAPASQAFLPGLPLAADAWYSARASTNIAREALANKLLDRGAAAAKAKAVRDSRRTANRDTDLDRQLAAGQISRKLRDLVKAPGSRAAMRGSETGREDSVLNPGQQQAIEALRGLLGPAAEIKVDRAEGTVRWVRGDLGELLSQDPQFEAALASGDPTQAAEATLRAMARALDVPEPETEFAARPPQADELGHSFVKFDQHWRGVPVYGGQLVVHLDPDGKPVQVNGVYAPDLANLPEASHDIGPRRALEIGRREIASADPELLEPRVEKVVYWYPNQARPVVSYQVELTPGPAEGWRVFVAAHDGTVVKRLPTVYAGVESGSAVDLLGQTRTVNSWRDGNTYFAFDASQPMYDAVKSRPMNLQNIYGGICVLDVGQQNIQEALQNDRVVWATATSKDGWAPTTVSMLDGLARTYNYYRAAHGQNSIDNAGCSVISFIHARFPGGGGQLTSDNAFYNSAMNAFIFGDGDAEFTKLPSALDVIAHEFTHGVSHHHAALVYQNQSGALSEHLSDFFGCMVDRDEWLAGDGIMVDPNLVALRDMSDPQNPRVQSRLPKTMAAYQNLPATPDGDNGGVHINCGIPNYASYLMTDGPGGMGRDKAERVVYRALKQGYLTSNSQFVDYRRALVQSAKDLYGDGAEAAAVRQAFDTVGITDGTATPPPSTGTPTSGTELALYLEADFDPLFGEFLGYMLKVLAANGNTLVASRYVTETRPAVSGDGSWALYVGTDNNLYYTDGQEEEQLTTTANIRTIAMTKDSKIVAFTTTDYDNQVGILEIATDQARFARLQVPTDAEGVVMPLSFADVLTFNFAGDVLVLDAFAEGGSGTSELGAWGTYALRVKDLTLTSVFPASASLQVGNPSLAHTLDYVLVADFVATSATTTNIGAVAVDLLQAKAGELGSELATFAQPTFRGDDNKIVYRFYEGDFAYLNEAVLTPDKMGIAPNSNAALLMAEVPLAYPVGFREGTYIPSRGKCEVLGAGPANSYRIDFSDVPVGGSSVKTISITNSGNADFTIIHVQLDGAGAASFSQDAINRDLPAGQVLPVRVTFAPRGTGPATATLRVQTSVPGESDVLVALAGSGTAAADTDTDGDGLLDWQEQVAGTDPANPASVFKLLRSSRTAEGLVLEWSSVAGKIYSVSRAGSLLESFTVLQAGISGQAGVTRFTDPGARTGGPYFYRVSVQ